MCPVGGDPCGGSIQVEDTSDCDMDLGEQALEAVESGVGFQVSSPTGCWTEKPSGGWSGQTAAGSSGDVSIVTTCYQGANTRMGHPKRRRIDSVCNLGSKVKFDQTTKGTEAAIRELLGDTSANKSSDASLSMQGVDPRTGRPKRACPTHVTGGLKGANRC